MTPTEELAQLQLEKARLEKTELEAKIRNVETSRERWLKLGVAAFVPLITVSIALTAAYLELRRIQDEKQQVQTAKADLEKLKEADFQKARIDKALALLSGSGSSAGSTSTPKVFLAAMQDILLSGVPATPNLANAIVSFVGNSDTSVSETASEVLKRLNAPEIVAAAITSRLFEATGSVRLQLLRVLLTLPTERIESDLSRLLSSGDAIIAGGAAFALATSKEVNWTRIDLSDSSKPPETIESQFNVVLMQQDAQIRAKALVRPLEGLFHRDAFTLGTPTGRAACYFLNTTERIPNVEEVHDKLRKSTEISAINRLALHAMAGDEADKKAVQSIYNQLREDPRELKKTDRLILDLIQRRLDLGSSLKLLPYSDDYVQGLTSEVSAKWASHLDWDTVPIDVLKSWADQPPSGNDAYVAFRSRARDKLFERMGPSQAIKYFEELKLSPFILAPFWSREETKKAKIQEYVDGLIKNKGRLEAFESLRLLEFMNDKGLIEDSLQRLAEFDFDILATAISRAKAHKDVVLKVLNQLKERGKVGYAELVLIATLTDIPDQLGEWASSAAIQAIQELETADLSQYLRNTRQFDRRFIRGLALLSYVPERRLRDDLQSRFSKVLNTIPSLIINDFSYGWGSSPAFFLITQSNQVGLDRIFHEEFKQRVPGFIERRTASFCGQDRNIRGADVIAYKVLFAKYAIGIN